MFGHDEGYPAGRMREAGIPSLDGEALDAAVLTPETNGFDVVTAIEGALSTGPTRCPCCTRSPPSCARAGSCS